MHVVCLVPQLPLHINIYCILTCAYNYQRGKGRQQCVHANCNSRSAYFPLAQSSTVKTETISFGSVSPGGVKLEISTKEVPVVHTETKTITYESSQVRCSVKTEPWLLISPLCGLVCLHRIARYLIHET